MNDLTVLNEYQISEASTDALKERLAESLEFTAKHLTYMGMLWRELESRGEDLSHLKKGMSIYIPMIAYGKLDARLVIGYAGQQTLLTALAELDTEEQLKLIEKPVVDVFDPSTEETKQKELIDLRASEIQQIFGTKGVRSSVEQIKLANKPSAKKSKKKSTKVLRKVIISDNKMIVGGASIDLAKVVDALSEHYDVDIKSLIIRKK